MPHVASKASVLQSQHSGLTQRDRMPETKTDDSPFSNLLADTGSAPAPTRHQSSRAQNSTTSQRTDGSRPGPQRPQRSDDSDAADPTADAAATGPTEGAAEPIEVAAMVEAPQIGEIVSKPAAEAEPATDEPATPDAALAAVVEAPIAPPPQQTVAADPALLAAAPAPVAAEAPAETGVETPATGAIAPVAPDAVGASEPTPPQAPQTRASAAKSPVTAPQVTDQHVADQPRSRSRSCPTPSRPARRPRQWIPTTCRNRPRPPKQRRRRHP